jgi:hypothetical protein
MKPVDLIAYALYLFASMAWAAVLYVWLGVPKYFALACSVFLAWLTVMAAFFVFAETLAKRRK